jgi:TRAP-type C4-dicarboxylate transport system permease small subunit
VKSKDLLVTAFVLGLVLLSWPFLTIVNRSRAVLGIPLLVLYLFVVWGGVILLLWLTQRRGAGP